MYKHEQDSSELFEKARSDDIGKTWYRIRVGIYCKTNSDRKDYNDE